jgi:uncharacterized protein (TIGR02145 family)
MKKILLFLFLIQSAISLAQAPQGFNYQATVRNSSGDLIVNQNVNFKFNLMQNAPTSVPVYSETHLAPTDDLGAVNLVIGKGTATTGIFSNIDWANGTYYLGIELNTGNGYVAMGTTQLLSVPYALYAQNSGSSLSNLPNGNDVGDILVWNGNSWQVSSNQSSGLTPLLSTNQEIQYSAVEAYSGGTIQSDNGYSITSKGLVWSLESDPKISLNTKTNEGAGAQNFSSKMSGLTPLKNYYYRAYATNTKGTAYGNTYNFITLDVLPIVVTNPISNISYLSAKSGVTITNLGSDIISSGIIYGTNPQLLTENSNSIIEGEGILSIENLSPDTKYYVRAFAKNNKGIAYGNVEVFTTLTDDLSVTTGQFSNLTFNTVEINGNNTNNDGVLDITQRGVIVSEQMEGLNLISNYKNYITKNGIGPGTFNATFTELEQGVRYFYRAYAINEAGVTVYGLLSDNYQFTTPFNYGSVTDIDQNTYKTIVLDNQEWMAENLKVTRFNDGTSLTKSTSSSFWFNNDSVNTNLYTVSQDVSYYNSSVVSGNYNICPQGWRIPTREDWNILISNLDLPDKPMGNLMSNSNEWQLFEGKPNGFNLKLLGAISADGAWYDYYQKSLLWLSNNKVLSSKNNYNYTLQDFQNGDKGACIRCIKG